MYVAAGFAATAVGLSKGGLPAIGVLAVPILALAISPVAAAAIILPLLLVSDVVGLVIYRRHFDRRNLQILIPSALAGVGVGWATASIVSEAAITLLVGLIGLTYCANALARRRTDSPARRADIPRGLLWGTTIGVTSFVSHAGGPPFQVYVLPQRLEKLTFVGTGAILFAVVNLAKVGPYYALGQFSSTNLAVAAWVAPVAIVTTWLGARLVRVIPEETFFRVVEVALAVISVKLIFEALRAF